MIGQKIPTSSPYLKNLYFCTTDARMGKVDYNGAMGEYFAPKGTEHELNPAILAGEPDNCNEHRVGCVRWE